MRSCLLLCSTSLRLTTPVCGQTDQRAFPLQRAVSRFATRFARRSRRTSPPPLSDRRPRIGRCSWPVRRVRPPAARRRARPAHGTPHSRSSQTALLIHTKDSRLAAGSQDTNRTHHAHPFKALRAAVAPRFLSCAVAFPPSPSPFAGRTRRRSRACGGRVRLGSCRAETITCGTTITSGAISSMISRNASIAAVRFGRPAAEVNERFLAATPV